MSVWKRLDLFWLRAASSFNKFKLLVWNAVIKSKLMYGLESMQLNKEHRDSLRTFQLTGLLRLKTTFIDISNTNEK
eukprot:8320710-Prorocentrum_lima.AAC.1